MEFASNSRKGSFCVLVLLKLIEDPNKQVSRRVPKKTREHDKNHGFYRVNKGFYCVAMVKRSRLI